MTEKVVKTERPWNVVVWDDPVTPMSVVVVINHLMMLPMLV